MTDGVLRIEIFVDDVGRSADWYERALGFERESTSPGYAAVRRGDARIGIGLASDLRAGHYLAKSVAASRAGGVEIVIEVDDVDAAYAAAQAIGSVLTPLQERPWGLRDFRLADPDGYYLRVTSRGPAG